MQSEAQRLKAALHANNVAHTKLANNADLLADLRCLQAWQSARLHANYADLAAQPQYRLAVAFFEDDLYAPRDFSQRDRDVEKIYPIMIRLLPDSMLGTVANAVELAAMTYELDLILTQCVTREEAMVWAKFGEESYAKGYRAADEFARRRAQLDLLATIASDLNRLVRQRFVYRTLKMTGIPARMAGLGELQSFLERGFDAFAAMDDATPFIEAVLGRERHTLELIEQGSDRPLSTAQPHVFPDTGTTRMLATT